MVTLVRLMYELNGGGIVTIHKIALTLQSVLPRDELQWLCHSHHQPSPLVVSAWTITPSCYGQQFFDDTHDLLLVLGRSRFAEMRRKTYSERSKKTEPNEKREVRKKHPHEIWRNSVKDSASGPQPLVCCFNYLL